MVRVEADREGHRLVSGRITFTLAFRDVFSEGFAFDDITGAFRIDNGQMHTENLKLAGPAAAVTIKGDIDLAKEPLGTDPQGQAVFLKDVWPSNDEVASAVDAAARAVRT